MFQIGCIKLDEKFGFGWFSFYWAPSDGGGDLYYCCKWMSVYNMKKP